MPFEDVVPAAMGGSRLRFVSETDPSAADHAAISALLIDVFPGHAEVFRAASCTALDPSTACGWSGTTAAPLPTSISSVASSASATGRYSSPGWARSPRIQTGEGLGRRLMAGLRRVLTTQTPADFGYLGCREEVVGFYERVGWRRIFQKVREIDPAGGEWTVSDGPTLVLPATAPWSAWPGEGEVDLRGMWW